MGVKKQALPQGGASVWSRVACGVRALMLPPGREWAGQSLRPEALRQDWGQRFQVLGGSLLTSLEGEA